MNRSATITSLIDENIYHLSDLINPREKRCHWKGGQHSSVCNKFFTRVITKYGSCFTFNKDSPVSSIHSGSQTGLVVTTNIMAYEYSGRLLSIYIIYNLAI